jgi:hypothetical protein
MTRFAHFRLIAYGLIVLAALVVSWGCSTREPRKPNGGSHVVRAGAALEQFLAAHEFHSEGRDIYSRRYRSLKEASDDLGVSLVGLRIPENGPPSLEYRDERVFELNGWHFTVLAEKGRTLDDLNTPCTVGTSLVQAL